MIKIVQETSSQLSLRSYPYFAWIFGVASIALVVNILQPILNSQTITCDRRVSAPETTEDSVSGRCQLESGIFWRKVTQSLALRDIQRAEVESSRGGDGNTMQRVVLLTKQQSVPLNNFSFGLIDHAKQVSRINAFLQNPQQPTLRVAQYVHGSVLLPIGIISSMGLAMIVFMGHITTCELDKLSGQFRLKRRGLLNHKEIEYPLHHIKGMQITSSKRVHGTNYQLNFILTSEILVPIETFYSSGYSSKESTAQTICTFLGLDRSEGLGLDRSEDLGLDRSEDLGLDRSEGLGLDRLEGTPFSMEGFNVLKFLFMTLKIARQRDSAIAKYREKIHLDPDNINAYSPLAIALTLDEKYDEAKLILEQLRERLLAEGKTKKTEQIRQFLQGLGILHVIVIIKKMSQKSH